MRRRDLPVWLNRQLHDAQVVAEGVAQPEVDAVRVLRRLLGDFDTAGAKAVFTAYVDDYAEVWINGQMPRRAGVPSPATIQGFNMPNHVVLTDSANPGEKFQIAIFGINGPISVAPSNFIFFRQASVELYK